jgi:phosphoribosylformylglycinamidine cyclo-ligase
VRLDLPSIPIPPVFGWLARTGGVAEPEMLRTFNCGIGMIVVVAPPHVDAVSRALQAAGETAVLIGEVTPGGEPRVATSGALQL